MSFLIVLLALKLSSFGVAAELKVVGEGRPVVHKDAFKQLISTVRGSIEAQSRVQDASSFFIASRTPSTLVAVFSRRASSQQRALVRDMWLKVQYASRGNVTVKFVLCANAADRLLPEIDKEHAVHGDIYMMSCQEGSEGDLLARKTLMALKAFRDQFPVKDLFMKVHDDTFVRWSLLTPFLLSNYAPNAYIGDLQPEGPVCHNKSHPHYVEHHVFPFENYPAAMASHTGVILGRGLVEHILDTPEQPLVPDPDRAVGIWVNRQKKRHGYPVRYIEFDSPTADEKARTPERRRAKTWRDYRFLSHHGLAGEAIACLALAEDFANPDRRLSDCFKLQAKGKRTWDVSPCVAERRAQTNLLQRRTTVQQNHLQRHVEVMNKVGDVKGSRVDWKTHRQRLTFVHIPKNGGTAIEQAGQAGGVWWPRKWLTFWHGLTMPDGSVCEKYHVPPQYLKAFSEKDWVVFDDPGTFCVTRHPYERAVSEYKYMLSVAWGRSMSQMYNTGLYDKPKCTVEGLNNFLTKALQNALGGKRFQHDCHMLPQTEFIWGRDGKQWCRHILRTENMEAGFNALMEKYNYPVRLSSDKSSSKSGRINNSSEACPGLSTADLTLSTRRLLDALYKADFERLNYSKSQKDLVFMHIPRNMGSLVEAAATKEQRAVWPGRRKDFKDTRVQMPESSWCDKIHSPVRFLEPEDAAIFLNSDVFCIIRHPYERVVSVYNMVAGMKARKDMLSYYGISGDDVCSPEGLNSFVQHALEVMMKGRPFAVDCQLTPQHVFIWDAEDRQVCTNIVRHVDMPHALDKMMVSKGFVDMNFSAYAQSAQRKQKAACSMMPGNLTPETRKMLDTYYHEDFAKLGFSAW